MNLNIEPLKSVNVHKDLLAEICHFDTPKYKNLVSQVKEKQVFIYGLQLNDNKINSLTKNFDFESS